MTSYEEKLELGESVLHGLEEIGEKILPILKEFVQKFNPLTFFGDVFTALREILHGLGDFLGGDLRRFLESLREPEPDPAKVRDLASAFTGYAAELEHHDEDLRQAKGSLTEQIWDDVGSKEKPAEAARGSLDALAARAGQMGPAAKDVAKTLDAFADQMATAREKYRAAREEYEPVSTLDRIIDKAPALPWHWPRYFGDVFHTLQHSIQGMLAAHKEARAAGLDAQGQIRKAQGDVHLPDHTSPNMDVFASIGQSSANGSGPLREGVQARADQAIEKMSAEDQAKVKALLANARSDEERAWILAAAAAGHDVPTLTNYANRLKQMSTEEITQLDPREYSDAHPANVQINPDGGRTPYPEVDARGKRDGAFIQPDGTTCGSSSLVMAKMMNDPVFAMQIMTGYDAKAGAQDARQGPFHKDLGGGRLTKPDGTPDGTYTRTADFTPAEQRFAEAAQRMHDVTTDTHDRGGNLQFPWMEGLGTAPWGAAHEMGAPGGAGIPGHSYDWHPVNQYNQDEQFQAVAAAAQHGEVLPLYVGGSGYPQHVVLVTGCQGDNLTVYEPGSGNTYSVSREEFTGQKPLSTAVFNDQNARVWGTVTPQ
ncbi:WXG100 family type VII secretion target [Segniliparus rugosus]|uniref:Uncharacterized protein n=1 Tax=Segniliparus rugosus (strain ATCC BAA-974 / DSM 45345 / CCUG 50838 / CIP 108380 / JCM 13579 / CDC 945) TaxID=679197 RepID=E5XU13_SEGRC|nr:hypothetical protein [Segniliparus rugosus]EFV12182.1 hypothetical protein HMPREF9336_02985 [Segniliparus rugosus ATCC BAA-974]